MLLALSAVDGLHAVSLRTNDIVIGIVVGILRHDVPVVGVSIGYLGHAILLKVHVVVGVQHQGHLLTIDAYPELVGELVGQDIIAVLVITILIELDDAPAEAHGVAVVAFLVERDVTGSHGRGCHLDERLDDAVLVDISIADLLPSGIHHKEVGASESLGGSIVIESDVLITKVVEGLGVVTPLRILDIGRLSSGRDEVLHT